MDVNKLLREMAANPDVVDTWDDATRDAVLSALGVDVAAMHARFLQRRDPRMERVIAYFIERPHLINSVPVDIMQRILDYIGVHADAETAAQAFREAGVKF